MATLQHLILAPDADPEVKTADLNYSAIVGIVGYPLEIININGGAAVMYVCEEGKQKALPRNEAATRLAAPGLREDDYISGTALIVGPTASGGVDSSLSDEMVSTLLADGDME